MKSRNPSPLDYTFVSLRLDSVAELRVDQVGRRWLHLYHEVQIWLDDMLPCRTSEDVNWYLQGLDHIQFCFRDPKDAMMFKLAWGGE